MKVHFMQMNNEKTPWCSLQRMCTTKSQETCIIATFSNTESNISYTVLQTMFAQ